MMKYSLKNISPRGEITKTVPSVLVRGVFSERFISFRYLQWLFSGSLYTPQITALNAQDYLPSRGD